MDETLFAHLYPKRRAAEFAAQVREFIAKCPEVAERNTAYGQILRSCECIDCFNEKKHLLPYRTETDQYRVRTKARRAEVAYIIFFLPFVDAYGNESLDSERQFIIASGKELTGIYDAIIEACSR